jgi:4-aminobutyrate--pyruvate transaminase
MDLVGRVREIAPYFQAKLARFRGQPMVGEVAGIGMVGVVELVRDAKTREPFDPALRVGPTLMNRALGHGLVMRALGDRIAFSPPLIITKAEIDELFERFGRVLEDVRKWAASGHATN